MSDEAQILITALHKEGFSYPWIAAKEGVGVRYLYKLLKGEKTASVDLVQGLDALLSSVIEEGIEPERKPYTRVKPIPKQSTHNRKRREHQVQPERRTQQPAHQRVPTQRSTQQPLHQVQPERSTHQTVPTHQSTPRVEPAPRTQQEHQVAAPRVKVTQKMGCDDCHKHVRAREYPLLPGWYYCDECAINRGQVPPR